MAELVLRGRPASPGLGAGAARLLAVAVSSGGPAVPERERPAERARAIAALERAAAELDSIAAELRAAGRTGEAEIVATGSLMAADPALASGVERRILETGMGAAAALTETAAEHADALAAIGDETLAARADDVLSLGRRAARIASGTDDAPQAAGATVLVAQDLGPADVAELDRGVRAIALVAGGATAHAAIVARSLGLPLVAGLGNALLRVEPGEPLVVDGVAGEVVRAPSPQRVERAEAARVRREHARTAAAAARDLPAQTIDGHRVTVLVNASCAAETVAGLEAGAAGIGLLRTELAFLQADGWPSASDHLAALMPVLEPARGRDATVRVLDFGGDKTPPFLRDRPERGIALLLAHPQELEAQLAAIVEAAADTRLRVMLPLVGGPADVEAVRARLPEGVELGAMIETRAAAEAAPAIATVSDFLSIGTNDLTHSALGSDRFAGGDAIAHHPQVLALIARTVEAAREAGIPLEVCGEAASDPVTFPLLVGLGVDELSVGASRVGAVRAWVRALDYLAVRATAREALGLSDAAEVARVVGPVAGRLVLLEAGEAGAEGVDGGARVAAIGGQA
jgi:phosphoenolpyruvate-protein kinase (PTS system EI component)